MVDSITSLALTSGPFDTAELQIAQALAQAATAHTNALAYLREVAKANDAANAHALDTRVVAPVDTYGNLTLAPSNLTFLTEFTPPLPSLVASDISNAQQLHDMGILQRDAVLLEETLNVSHPIPLSSGASTVDLSVAAQGASLGVARVSASISAVFTPAQLTHISSILKPIANVPLTPKLLLKIQSQLSAGPSPMQLSLNTIALAMNLIAGMQPSPYHSVETVFNTEDHSVVAPVSAIDAVAAEDMALR